MSESKNRNQEVPLEDWPVELLEARLTNLQMQMVKATEHADMINQAALTEMSKFQAVLSKLIEQKKAKK